MAVYQHDLARSHPLGLRALSQLNVVVILQPQGHVSPFCSAVFKYEKEVATVVSLANRGLGNENAVGKLLRLQIRFRIHAGLDAAIRVGNVDRYARRVGLRIDDRVNGFDAPGKRLAREGGEDQRRLSPFR